MHGTHDIMALFKWPALWRLFNVFAAAAAGIAQVGFVACLLSARLLDFLLLKLCVNEYECVWTSVCVSVAARQLERLNVL